MKHPLSSKERRGLTAVAAAALLCIGGGFVFRACSGGKHGSADTGVVVVDNDSVMYKDSTQRLEDSPPIKNATNGKRARRAKRSGRDAQEAVGNRRSSKNYPTRQPLDEPCD